MSVFDHWLIDAFIWGGGALLALSVITFTVYAIWDFWSYEPPQLDDE